MTLRAAKDQPDEKEDSVILSVRLASGRFESSIQVPLFCTDTERQHFVEAWLKMMEAGIKCGRERRKPGATGEGTDDEPL